MPLPAELRRDDSRGSRFSASWEGFGICVGVSLRRELAGVPFPTAVDVPNCGRKGPQQSKDLKLTAENPLGSSETSKIRQIEKNREIFSKNG